jgi:hypothetical protein
MRRAWQAAVGVVMKPRWLFVLLLIGLAALIIRTLLDSRFGQGTLLYIAVPYGLSVALFFTTRPSERPSVRHRFWNHMRLATIIFLATSAILFEGFLCVLMFMPIYYFFVLIAFFTAWQIEKHEPKQDSVSDVFRSHATTAVVLALISEGLLPLTTIDRRQHATFVADTELDIASLKQNMAQPITFSQKRHWFLKLFPLPDEVQAGSLNSGDIHRLHFTYKKWFFANFHKGDLLLRISEVSPRRVRTQIVKNDSYLSHYMKIEGTEINFTPLPKGGTRVALTVKYQRLLDPVWYFGPMQHLAAKQSARYFLETIIIRQPVVEVAP